MAPMARNACAAGLGEHAAIATTAVTTNSSQASQPKYALASPPALSPPASSTSPTSPNEPPPLNQSTAVKEMTVRIAPIAATTVPTTPNS